MIARNSTFTYKGKPVDVKHATIAVINKVPMPAETLAQLPKLRLIAVAARILIAFKRWPRLR